MNLRIETATRKMLKGLKPGQMLEEEVLMLHHLSLFESPFFK